MDFRFQRGCALGKLTGEQGEHLTVDGDAAALHFGQRCHHRAFQTLINHGHFLSSEAWFEDFPEAQGDVCIFRRIGGGFVQRHLVEGDLRFTGAAHFLERNWRVVEPALGQLIHAIAAHTRVERVGEQHGVIKRCHFHAVTLEHEPVVLHVLRDFEDSWIFQHWLEQGNSFFERDLTFQQRTTAEEITFAIHMRQRDVTGFARSAGEGNADKASFHGVEGICLSVHSHVAHFIGLRYPLFEALRGRNCFVCGIIYRQRRYFSCNFLCQRGGGPCFTLKFSRRILSLFCRFCSAFPAFNHRLNWLDVFQHSAGFICHFFGEAGEAHGFEEADSLRAIHITHREIFDRSFHRNGLFQLHEALGNAGLLSELDEVLAALLLLDGVGLCQKAIQIAKLVDEQSGGFEADARDAGHVINAIASERLHFDDLFRANAKFFEDLWLADHLVLHGVDHADLVGDKLHQVFITGNNGDAGALCGCLTGVGGDQVIRLIPLLLNGRHAKRARCLTDQAKLWAQIFWRRWAVSFVFRVEIVAERFAGLIENHGEVGWLITGFFGGAFLHHLPKHVAEAGNRANGQSVGLASKRRQRMICAENEGRAIDQDEVIVLCESWCNGLCRHERDHARLGPTKKEELTLFQ